MHKAYIYVLYMQLVCTLTTLYKHMSTIEYAGGRSTVCSGNMHALLIRAWHNA